MVKKLMRERIFPPSPKIVKPNGKYPLQNEDDEMLIDNFESGLEDEFDVICMLFLFCPLNSIRSLR